jgi:hypothetical protein
VHVSLLDEKTHSEGTDEACVGRMSIAMQKAVGIYVPFAAKYCIHLLDS